MQRWNFTQDNNICSFRSLLYWHSSIRHNLFSSSLGWKASAFQIHRWIAQQLGFGMHQHRVRLIYQILGLPCSTCKSFISHPFLHKQHWGSKHPVGEHHGGGHLIRRAWGTPSGLVCWKDIPTLLGNDSYTCSMPQQRRWLLVLRDICSPPPGTRGGKVCFLIFVFSFSSKAAEHHNTQLVQRENRILCSFMFKPRNPKGFHFHTCNVFLLCGW